MWRIAAAAANAIATVLAAVTRTFVTVRRTIYVIGKYAPTLRASLDGSFIYYF